MLDHRTTSSASSADSATQGPIQYLTLRLGQEEYGVEVLRVQEIRSYQEPTRLAQAPAVLKGVINLRGVVVPVMDLRLGFGAQDAHFDESTVTVVVKVGERVVGLVVDSVSDVINLRAQEILPMPGVADENEHNQMRGIATVDGRMLILLDIERVLSTPEFGLAMSSAIH